MNDADAPPIYLDLMRFKPDGLSPNGWAVQAGVSRTVWADMRRHGNPSRRTLERLLRAAGSSLAEFEALRLGPEPKATGRGGAAVADPGRDWAPPPLPPLNLLRTAPAGDWGSGVRHFAMTELHADAIAIIPRPRSLADDPDAFALTIAGDSMWPRFPAGRRVAVSPRAKVGAGDDVLVRLSPAGEKRQRVLIKHLVGISDRSIELRQFNPDLNVRIERAAVSAVMKIPGELI